MRSQDAVFVIAAVASNPGDIGRNLAWKFLKENWAAMHKRYGGGEVGASLCALPIRLYVLLTVHSSFCSAA